MQTSRTPASPFDHGMATLSAQVRIHYVIAGGTDALMTVVLVHGYPQHWWQWRHVLPLLAEAKLRVIAIDYRGAGRSSPPPDGYDKHTLAGDVHAVVRDHLKINGRIAIAGHDIGSMVAFAYALAYPDECSHVMLSEAPLPGTLAYDALLARTTLASDPLWHFRFHNAPGNIAETMVFGRQRAYVDDFFDRLAFNGEAIGPADRDRYADAMESIGALRAGFELYRAFDRDAEQNRAALKAQGRLTMPVLALSGEHSALAPSALPMMKEVAKNVTFKSIPAAGHWIAEENPAAVAEALISFFAAEKPA